MAATPAPAATARQAAFAALRRLDQRVATTGFRLASRAAEANLCARQEWQLGFSIHHLSQYQAAAQADAARSFNLREAPGVLAVAEGSPAATAGLHADDAILSADGVPMPLAAAGARNTFAPSEAMLAAIEAAFADGVARLELRRNGNIRATEIRSVRGCAARFQVVPSDEREARADGRYVQITSASAAFADSDTALAAALAHELAHNILRHRARLNEAGVERGLLQHFGRNARLFRQTELEADRYSMYLLDAAGYDLQATLAFWERFGRAETNPLPTTHPSWSVRIAAMRAEAATIGQAKKGGRTPRPPNFDIPLR